MADKTTTTTTLNIIAGFADGDDRTINIDNPNTAINLGNAVYSLGSFAQQNQVILGDKAGSAFTEFKSAKLVTKTKTILDLG